MPLILVHGGAWDIPRPFREPAATACREAADAGWSALRGGASALEAVLTAVRSMEDAPVLGAGIGAAPDANGHFSLDASLMVGADLTCGCVANVPPMRHPIDLARAVLEHSEHVLLAGPGALAWGADHGLRGCDPEALRTPFDAHGLGCDTVGAIVLDDDGRLVCGTSTGGTPRRHAARVGDAPLIGCGTYADDRAGAAGSTGVGEAIIRVTLARSVVDAIAHGEAPMRAAERLVSEMTERTGAHGGAVCVAPDGRWGVAHTTPAMCGAVRGAEARDGGWIRE